MFRMQRSTRILLALLAVALGLFVWLLRTNFSGDAPAKPVTMTQLRALASAMPGAAPERIELELVAHGRFPGDFLAAGTGLSPKVFGVFAYRLTGKGMAPVMIDAGLTEAVSDDLRMSKFHAEQQGRVDTALRDAGLILFTHEHVDHMGGLIAALRRNPQQSEALLSRVQFNRGQLPGGPLSSKLDWPLRISASAHITDGAPQAVAPGIVAIPAPSHTPGSQMFYVRLTDGREWLFTGDIATLQVNWLELRGQSKFLQYYRPEDRDEVFAWLRTIRKLKAQAPGLNVVAGHDYAAMFDRKQKQIIPFGFKHPG